MHKFSVYHYQYGLILIYSMLKYQVIVMSSTVCHGSILLESYVDHLDTFSCFMSKKIFDRQLKHV
jgi:hypothetical protein